MTPFSMSKVNTKGEIDNWVKTQPKFIKRKDWFEL